MGALGEALTTHKAAITDYLHVGYAVWDDLIARVQRQGAKPPGDCVDEQLWTFLVGCGYAIARKRGVTDLTRLLTGSEHRSRTKPNIWFEVLPTPPRKKEGETHVDLALGTSALRDGTGSGIRLDEVKAPWVCFCEMKWYADISCRVTYDLHRNQLARVIENALCFQTCGRYAEKVYVTLVTPAAFRDAAPKCRLYQYKFEEYNKPDRAPLIADLKACALTKSGPPKQPDWFFPRDLAERAKSLLSLRWVTYDELFDEKNLPDSAIVGQLLDFWAKYGNYQGRR
jgi:hypothetical protein